MADHLNKRISKLEERVGHLERLNTPRQEDPHTAGPHKDAEQDSEPAPGKSPPTNRSANNGANSTYKRKSDGHPWWIRMWVWKPWKRVLTVLVGLAGIVYAFVTYWQWRDLGHNFSIDERAWIMPIYGYPKTLTPERTASATLMLKNVGKSPALRIDVIASGEIVDSKLPPPLSGRHKGGTLRLSTMAFPQVELDPTEIFLGATERKFTTEDLERLMSGRAYMVVFGIIQYADQFGDHWSRFCGWHSYRTEASYNARDCTLFNAVGDGRVIDLPR